MKRAVLLMSLFAVVAKSAVAQKNRHRPSWPPDISNLRVTFADAAGDPATAPTQPMAPPMYLSKDPRNWLTVKSGDKTHVLRVSEKVYAKLKESLQTHNVQVEESK